MTNNPWGQSRDNNPEFQQNPPAGAGSYHQNSSQWGAPGADADATIPLQGHHAENSQQAYNHQASGSYSSAQGQASNPYGYPQQGAYDNSHGYYAQPGQEQYPVTHENPRKKHTTRLLLTSAALAALIGGGVGGCAATLGSHGGNASTVSSGTTIVNNTDSVNTVTAAAEKATPSVVTISVAGSGASGSGSGIVFDDQGHILTNTHVVTLDGAAANADVEVKLSDGTVKKASIVGTDPTSDLAVVKIDPSGLNLTPATLGDSDKLNVGDIAVAIGAPLGLDGTVTDGIISTLSRTIEVASSAAPEGDQETSGSQNSQQDSPFQFELPGQSQQQQAQNTISLNVLQTDAAVNPGNSGGALVNSQGEVIGVNVAIASAGSSSSSSEGSTGNIGVGFSIPINYAQRIAQEIIQNGSASHGYLGASVSSSPANNDSSQSFGDGAVIQSTVSGEAAEKAGLKEGDVIVEFNGKKISEANELTAAVRQAAPGDTVKAKVQRGNSTEEVEITLGNSDNANN